jgi:hypothetical protein
MRYLQVAALLIVVALAAGCAAQATPIYTVNAGAMTEAYTDTEGRIWTPDQDKFGEKKWGAIGGSTVARMEQEIAGTPAPKIFLTERYGMEAYEFAVEPGTYNVVLHFAETYDGILGEGERVFDVKVEDKLALENVDPFKAGGGLFKPVCRKIEGVEVADDVLRIEFVFKTQSPQVCGIEILKVK